MEWVDRHGCRESRDGPWMARGGVPTELTCAREPERSEGRTMGRGLFGSFLVLQKGTRRKGETNIPVRYKCRICTQRFS